MVDKVVEKVYIFKREFMVFGTQGLDYFMDGREVDGDISNCKCLDRLTDDIIALFKDLDIKTVPDLYLSYAIPDDFYDFKICEDGSMWTSENLSKSERNDLKQILFERQEKLRKEILCK